MAESPDSRYEFLLVARHGRSENENDVREVTQGLAKTLSELRKVPPNIDIRFSRVQPSESPDAWRAACIFDQLTWVTGERRCRDDPQTDDQVLGLGPHRITAYHEGTSVDTKVKDTWLAVDRYLEHHRTHRKRKTPECPVNALMLVGNQPAIDWFLAEKMNRSEFAKMDWRQIGGVRWFLANRLDRFLPRKVDFGPISVAPGEVVCLARKQGSSRPWHLWWVMTPRDENAIEALREKVQSKLTVLSVLAGFTAAMLTTVAVNLAGPDVEYVRWLDRALMLAAVAFFSLAVVILVVALLGYDRLMMPQRFWGTVRSRGGPDPLHSWPVARPPSSAGWVLYQHSIRLWRWVMGALVLTGTGALLMIAAIARMCGGDEKDVKSSRPTLPCSMLPQPVELLAYQNPLESATWYGYAEMIGVGLIVLALIVFTPWAWRHLRPELGTED